MKNPTAGHLADLIKSNLRLQQDNFETNSHDFFRTSSRLLQDHFKTTYYLTYLLLTELDTTFYLFMYNFTGHFILNTVFSSISEKPVEPEVVTLCCPEIT